MHQTTKIHRTAGELAAFLGCELRGNAGTKIAGVASPERATSEDVIYLESPRHFERVLKSRAQCLICPSGAGVAGKALLISAEPKIAFARAAGWLIPPGPIVDGIHATAVIAASASVAGGVSIGPYAVVEEHASIGAGTQIGAFCFIGRGATVGESCRLHPRVTLYEHVTLGSRVIMHSGAVLGADGFGYATDREGKHWKFPQLGALEIGDDVEIGANTTIDRGSLDVTVIEAQVKLDNLVHVAHNVKIGRRTLIAAQTGIAGSSVIGNDVVIGGQVGIGDHCRLEDRCVAGAQAGIPSGKVIRRDQTVWGTPARSIERFKKQYGWFARLPEIAERLRRLEQPKPESL